MELLCGKDNKFLLFFREFEKSSIKFVPLALDQKNILVNKKNHPK